MIIAEVQMYDALKPALGEEDAKSFIGAFTECVNTKMKIMKDDLATKKDLSDVRNELKLDIVNLRGELKQDIANLRSECKGEISLLRAETLKAIYLTGLIQTIVIIGSVLAIIKSNS